MRILKWGGEILLRTRNGHLWKGGDLIDKVLHILWEPPWAGVLSGQLEPASYHEKKKETSKQFAK